jgi:hypothetical protein
VPSWPLLLIDVDGPLSPFAAIPEDRPAEYATHWVMPAHWLNAEQERINRSGRPQQQPVPLPVWLNPVHGAALKALPYQLVWASTWQEDANTQIAPVLGLPELPFVTWSWPRARPPHGVFWKTPDVVAWAKDRPFAWLDDEITDADSAWVRAHHQGPALLHRIDPSIGLTPDDFSILKDWASSHI